jgi:hypothetical protein
MNPSILTLLGLAMGAAPSEALPPIPVFLHGSSVVPAGALVEARQEAARILLEAGVETRWFECSPSAAGAQPEPACDGALRPSHVVVNIVARGKRQYQRVRSGSPVLMELLGEAICLEQTGGNHVTIYFKVVERRAQLSDARRARLLGYTIAHEIGHLLLGPQHSTGIMATDWLENDVLTVPADKLLFSASDRQRLETQVRARLRADQQVASAANR